MKPLPQAAGPPNSSRSRLYRPDILVSTPERLRSVIWVWLLLGICLWSGCQNNRPFQRSVLPASSIQPPPHRQRWYQRGPFAIQDSRHGSGPAVPPSFRDPSELVDPLQDASVREPFMPSPAIGRSNPEAAAESETAKSATPESKSPEPPNVTNTESSSGPIATNESAVAIDEAEQQRYAAARTRLDRMQAIIQTKENPAEGMFYIICEIPFPADPTQIRVYEARGTNEIEVIEKIAAEAEQWYAQEQQSKK